MILKERSLRINKIREAMQVASWDACLISTPVNTYYLHQRIFKGYTYLDRDGHLLCFVRRPIDLTFADLSLDEQQLFFIRKPEQLPNILRELHLPLPENLALEGEEMPRSEWCRLQACFPNCHLQNGSHVLRQVRSIKTDQEIECLRESARKHQEAYRSIPTVFRLGMSETDFCIEVEYLMRKAGCLGLFRTYGGDMEAYMGSLLAGDNAAVSSPYDFALGGAGHPSNPIGASQHILQRGESVLIDMCGNFTGYLDDLSRCYSIGKLPAIAYKAHQVCLDVQDYLQAHLKEGNVCEELYAGALAIVENAGFSKGFMGHRQQAKFVGHGIGLVINELPVLAPRMKDVLQSGMVLAVEPKIIIEGVGAVGVENSFVVGKDGSEKLANLSDDIVDLLSE